MAACVPKKKLCVVGSGNFGSTLAKVVAENAAKNDMDVVMWVLEEKWEDQLLTEVINKRHENPKYLPGIKFPECLRAEPNLQKAAAGADYFLFCLPHQFLPGTLAKMKSVVKGGIDGAIALTAIKGIHLEPEGVQTMSELIGDTLKIACGALSGANIAMELANELPTETTIACQKHLQCFWKSVFQRPYLMVNTVTATEPIQLFGALKNVVAVAAGFVDGLGFKNNTKAAIIRVGSVEMVKFAKQFYPNRANVIDVAFQESAGIADLIVTCYGGRNRKCAEAFARAGGKKPMADIEKELLNGQKLQGVLTAQEAFVLLSRKNLTAAYPLFTRVHEIAVGRKELMSITEVLS